MGFGSVPGGTSSRSSRRRMRRNVGTSGQRYNKTCPPSEIRPLMPQEMLSEQGISKRTALLACVPHQRYSLTVSSSVKGWCRNWEVEKHASVHSHARRCRTVPTCGRNTREGEVRDCGLELKTVRPCGIDHSLQPNRVREYLPQLCERVDPCVASQNASTDLKRAVSKMIPRR